MDNFFTEKQYKQLIINGAPENIGRDHIPVVKLFLPDENATWLLTSIDPEDNTKAYGLSDWGDGFPASGPINLDILRNIEGRHGFEVSRDAQFEGKFPLTVYAYAAQKQGGIIDRRTSHYDITKNETHLKAIALIKYLGKGPDMTLG